MSYTLLVNQAVADAQDRYGPGTPYASSKADHLPFDHPLQWHIWPYAIYGDPVITKMKTWLFDRLTDVIPTGSPIPHSWALSWSPTSHFPRGGYFIASRPCPICLRAASKAPWVKTGPFGLSLKPYDFHPATFLIETLEAWLAHQRGHLADQHFLLAHPLGPVQSRLHRYRCELATQSSALERVSQTKYPIHKRLSLIQFPSGDNP